MLFDVIYIKKNNTMNRKTWLQDIL